MFGYDPETGHLFSHDGDIRYNGIHTKPPKGTFNVRKGTREHLTAAACYFISGLRRPAIVLSDADGEESFWRAEMQRSRIGVEKLRRKLKTIPFYVPLCACGESYTSPEGAGRLCERFRLNNIRVAHLTKELSALGALIAAMDGKEKPRMLPLCVPDSSFYEGMKVSMTFDEKLGLPGDSLGRMAFFVAKGGVARNEVMRKPGVSPFYGKLLAGKYLGSGTPTFAVMSDKKEHYFPTSSFSVSFYAATSVPVRVKNTERFSEASGYKGRSVNILLSSDYIPGLSTFLWQHHAMSGRGFVCLHDPDEINAERVPIFGYHSMWVRKKEVQR